LYWAHAQPNLALLQEKIVYLPLLPQRWLRCVMQRVRVHSSISDKVINASVLLLQSAYLDFATLFLLAQRSLCRQDRLHRFYLLGKIAKRFIVVLHMPDLPLLNLLQIVVVVGRNL
jgi:hypothetical protein